MKNRRWTLVLAILIAVALVVGGCAKTELASEATSTKDEAAESEATSASQQNETTEPENPMEIIWLAYNQSGYNVEEGTLTQQLIEETFNVKLTIPTIDIFNEESWNLYWASGNTADHIQTNSMQKYFIDFAKQGLIRPITKDALYSYAPDWMESMEQLMDTDTMMAQISYEDQLWCMPLLYYNWAKNIYITTARKSWLDAIGIDKAPTTLDELHDMAYKLTWEDPDGNGVDDTYGICPYGSFGYVFGAYGLMPNGWYDIDGTITYANTMEKYKEALIELSGWYEEGLIDPEFITDDRSTSRSKWASGVYGAIYEHPGWLVSTVASNVSSMVLDNFEDEQLMYFPAVTGPHGDAAALADYPNSYRYGIYFGSETSDEKIHKIMEIENGLVADQELWVKCYYGVEGETYHFDEDGIIITDEAFTVDKIVEDGLAQTFGITVINQDRFFSKLPKVDSAIYEVAAKIGTKAHATVAFTINGENEAYNVKYEDVKSIADEFYYSAITGAVDIEAEWDSYVQELNDSGLQEILDEFENLIIRAG